MRSKPYLKSRIVAGVVFAAIIVVTTGLLLFRYEGSGQNSIQSAQLAVPRPASTPYPPAPPVGPTRDINVTISGDATAQARDEQERERANEVEATAIAAHRQGKPDPKEEQLRKYKSPIPEPIQTTEAYTVPLPANGITKIEVQRRDWQAKYHITNAWQGTINGTKVTLWAGSKADEVHATGPFSVWNNPEQGLVIYSPLGQNEQEFLSASRDGMLTLTASNGTCLTLVASNGVTSTFDVSNLKWGCTAAKQP